jgi:hypothetical protein
MPLQATSGAASYDGFGGGPAAVPNYIEDVFSTWLYTGNSSTQTITNGIDLSTNGGMVWLKCRSVGRSHSLYDTARGATNTLTSNLTDAQYTTSGLTSFNSNGFSLGSDAQQNFSTNTFVSWTFREQPKFFDIVTYTGDAGSNRAVSHNLGSVPGCIIVKSTSDAGTNWAVYHRSLGDNKYVRLNTTAASATAGIFPTVPTATEFYVGNFFDVNSSGVSYVAYLFAHNAGGFGLTGTDNVISCGSTLGTSTVNLGYEPQWILVKSSTSAQDWYLFDNMRGLTATVPSFTETGAYLLPNTSGAEATFSNGLCSITATGFDLDISSSQTYIYIAIRRGPMKTPTTGTSVFDADLLNGRGTVTTGFPVDWTVYAYPSATGDRNAVTRLIGGTRYLVPNTTVAEYDLGSNIILFDRNTSIYNDYNNINTVYWNFRRAPGFFDVVCYTGTGSARTLNHNLGVVPELMIIKSRSSGYGWLVYSAAIGNTNFLRLNTDDASATSTQPWNNTTPTSTVFTVGTSLSVNSSGDTYVAYLFATVAGVSKVGSYTGTGTTQQINCGFAGGARFVLIKRTDSTGDWYCWDSSRGIVSGNDPYLLLNSTAAEVTNTDYIDTYSAGFEISSTAPAAINANGGSFVFLAIS